MHYATDALPVSINTRWTKSYRTRPFEDIDEVVYVATWADGRVTEHFTLPRDWQDVFVASIKARLAGVDAALAEAAKPLSNVVTAHGIAA